jgi:hypothetical protein
MTSNYCIGTGYYDHPGNDEQFQRMLWAIRRHASPLPERIYVMSVGGSMPSQKAIDYAQAVGLPLTIIPCKHNLLHVGALLNGTANHEFCGWSAGVTALAMISYAAGHDMLYYEGDCCAFGPFVERMYSDMGSGGMVFGGPMKSPPWMESAQSLFLIRHSYLPHFVSRYLSMGKDGDPANLPETKYGRLQREEPHMVKWLSFGYDRCRPINFDDEVFYGQKWSESEMNEIKKRGLL